MRSPAACPPRAQEILRRADEQVQSLRRSRVIVAQPEPAPPPEALPVGLDLEPPSPERLMDRIQAGIDASRAHLQALQDGLELLAGELGVTLSEPVAAAPDPPEEEVEPEVEEEPPPLPPELAAHLHLPEEVIAAGPGERPARPDRPSGAAYDAGRLVAIEMAVAGDSREMVGRRLTDEFGIANPREILDDVFGPGSGAGSRMPGDR